ncbi:major capsid protein [Nostoc sp.]|uniref:major capsid protein n=1 Tax=Nostoc sp. TaxID=1180 RepID=UPI002FF95F49
MAMTLLEAAKITASAATATIIEEYAASSDILRAIPFEDVAGTGKHYNREDKLPGVGFRGINEGYKESVGVLNPQSEALKIFGGDLDVDRAIIDMQGEQVRSVHEMQKVKALALSWTYNFIKGDSSIDPRGFDGLQVRLTGTQLISNNDAGGPLSLEKLDQLIDQVDTPTHLIMGKSARRKLNQAIRNRTVSGDVDFSQDEFGNRVMSYNGLPILIADYDNNGNIIMDFTETSPDGASSTQCQSIYCVCFKEMMLNGIQGAVDGVYGVSTRDLGELETKPVFRTRVDWYTAIACYHGRAAGRLYGITNAPPIS